MASRPGLLVVSGLDPSGGAGFVADVRLAERFGVRPVGVVTALTVQDTQGVRSMEVLSPDYVEEQLMAVLSDVEVHAVKLGMLGSADMARAVARALALTGAPVVWDPVARPSHGEAPLLGEPLQDVADILADHLTVMTPNVSEAELLASVKIADAGAAGRAALEMASRWNVAVCVTGGHLPGPPIDILAQRGDLTEVIGRRVPGADDVHGTGCALSTAVSCGLARGQTVSEAVVEAAAQIRRLLPEAPSPGRGQRAFV